MTLAMQRNRILEVFQTPENRMYEFLQTRLRAVGYRRFTLDPASYMLVPGEIPILLIAHIDTVHPRLPVPALMDQGMLWSPHGIGGDDRAGILAIMKILESTGLRPWLLFPHKEEVGAQGSHAFVEQSGLDLLPDDLLYMIEVDRMHADDSVYYSCDNHKFERYVNAFGFRTAQGSFSDISVLAPEFGSAAVNLSVGYYNPHTVSEYVVLGEVWDTANRITQMLREPPRTPFYYVRKKFVYTGAAYADRYYGGVHERWSPSPALTTHGGLPKYPRPTEDEMENWGEWGLKPPTYEPTAESHAQRQRDLEQVFDVAEAEAEAAEAALATEPGPVSVTEYRAPGFAPRKRRRNPPIRGSGRLRPLLPI